MKKLYHSRQFLCNEVCRQQRMCEPNRPTCNSVSAGDKARVFLACMLPPRLPVPAPMLPQPMPPSLSDTVLAFRSPMPSLPAASIHRITPKPSSVPPPSSSLYHTHVSCHIKVALLLTYYSQQGALRSLGGHRTAGYGHQHTLRLTSRQASYLTAAMPAPTAAHLVSIGPFQQFDVALQSNCKENAGHGQDLLGQGSPGWPSKDGAKRGQIEGAHGLGCRVLPFAWLASGRNRCWHSKDVNLVTTVCQDGKMFIIFANKDTLLACTEHKQ